MGNFLRLLSPRALATANRLRRASRGERWTVAFFSLIGVGFWVGLFALFGWLIGTFYEVEILGPLVAPWVLEMAVLSLFGLLCFSNIITALSTFYLAEDLELVLSLPVSRDTFHFARLADTIIQSSWLLVFFGAPLAVAFWRAYDAGPVFGLALLLVMPGMVLIPAAFGLGVASTLVRVFPARRLREAFALAGVLLLVVAFVALRVMRPERLMDPDSFESVAAYAAQLRVEIPLLFPPRWIADVLLAALRGRALPWSEVGLLLTGAFGATGVVRWLTMAVYDEGRARSQEARAARLARSPVLDALLALWTRPLSPAARAIVEKDVKTFVRDPAQWSQVFLVGGIVVISIATAAAFPRDNPIFSSGRAMWWANVLAFLAQASVGFILATLSTRFQFTAVSNERRGFWIVRTGPITARAFLWAKVWPTLLPMVVIGQVLAVSMTAILGASPVVIGVSSVGALALSFAISGLAVGMGARYPDFKADNAARVAASPAALLFMVLASVLVLAVSALELASVGLWLRAQWQERPVSAAEWAGILGAVGGVVALCGLVTVRSIHGGAAALWDRELPNS
jgi:ABC-2 type transport system permease protein